MLLLIAFLLGAIGLVCAVIFEAHATGMLFAGVSLGIIGAFLWLRKQLK